MFSEENIGSSETFPLGGTAPEAQPESSDPQVGTPESPEIGSFYDDMETRAAALQGQIVQGKVLKVTETEVLVDVGLKSEGAIPRGEYVAEDGSLTVAPGDVVDVWIEHYDESEGTVTVSRQKAAHLKVWEEIERAFRERKAMRGRVVERTKGGLIVDVGVRAFLPGSQSDLRPLRNLESLIGQEILCKVIRVIRKRNNVVVSRKLALEEETSRRKAELLEKLREGAQLSGRVKNITAYGAFIDLGGMDGLLHITDLAWGRVAHPSEVLQVGQEIRVKVLKHDAEKGRVSLGLKQLTPDPWDRVPSAYRAGDRARGAVVSVTDYGAFVELEPGVEGLIHVSEMIWSKRLRHPSKIVNLGDRVEVVVMAINVSQRRISLSLRQTLPDPWTTLGERFNVGTAIEARVRNLTDFGAFVEVEEGVDGLIHISDLSWTKRVKHPSEVLKKGQMVKAVVLSLNPAQRRLSLSLKQMEPDPWKDFDSKIRVGDLVRGKVARVTSFGAFFELPGGIEGLCHISEMIEPRGTDGKGPVEAGSEHEFRVIRMNLAERKIGLSLKSAASPASQPPSETANQRSPSVMAQALTSAGILPPGHPASLPPGERGAETPARGEDSHL